MKIDLLIVVVFLTVYAMFSFNVAMLQITADVGGC